MGAQKAPAARAPSLHDRMLLDGCRTALNGSSRQLSWWLAQHHDQIAHLLATARVHDPELIATLCERQQVTSELATHVKRAWGDLAKDPTAPAVDLTYQWLLLESLVRLNNRVVNSLAGYAEGLPLLRRATSLAALVDHLRPHLVDPVPSEIASGWVQLLILAAEFNLLAPKCATEAMRFADEAWLRCALLIHGTFETAQVSAHAAFQYAVALNEINKPEPGDCTEALRRLHAAADELDRFDDTVASVGTRLRMALAEAQFWYMQRRRGHVGYLSGALRQVQIIESAMADGWRRLAAVHRDVVIDDYRTLPSELVPTVSRLLVNLVPPAHLVGEHAAAEHAARHAVAISRRPNQRLDALLTFAHVQRRLDMRLRQHEEILRLVDAGALTPLSDRQRRRLYGRLAREHRELAGILLRGRNVTASFFWNRIADEWCRHLRDATHSEPVPADLPVGPIRGSSEDRAGTNETEEPDRPHDTSPTKPAAVAPSEAPSEGAAWLKRLRMRLEEENAVNVVLQLMAVGAVPNTGRISASNSEIVVGIDLVERWYPPGDGRRIDPLRFRCPPNPTPEDVERSALELAGEFVKTYADHLGVQAFLRLAQRTDLPLNRRRIWAERTLACARRSGRSLHAVRAQSQVLDLALEAGDPVDIAAQTKHVRELMRGVVSSTRGTADLVDQVQALLKRSTQVAGRLAGAGYPNLAFDIASTGTGLVRRLVASDPSLAEEFELVEDARAKQDRLSDELFDLMRRRISGGGGTQRLELPDLALGSIAERHGRSVAVVQLMGSGHEGAWALGVSVGQDRQVRYWAEHLDLDHHELLELRTTVWSQLRPRPRERRQILAKLHELVVGRFEHHFKDLDDIVFVQHGDFAGLPLHAAHSDRGFLIARHRVSYLPTPSAEVLLPTASGRALVGGWDPEIDADGEASELVERFGELGLSVSRPGKAAAGRATILDQDVRWDIVHLVAHGDFFPWPSSLRSRLRLSKNVSLTAGQWLRAGCDSSFVFLNSCSVGRHAPHAGDLNGFPLAMSVQGASTTISALAPVPSEHARRFATDFYRNWSGSDSLSAYRQACLRAIRDGAPVAAWAPYLHTGPPLPFSSVSPARPQNRSPAECVDEVDAPD